MKQWREDQKQAGCSGKEPFADKGHAITAQRRINRGKDASVNAYRCQSCGLWHVGHSAKKRGKQ